MKNLIGKVDTDRRGRLQVNHIGIDKHAKISVVRGDTVSYFIKPINPNHGGSSFQVVVPTRVFSEQELIEEIPVLHKFEKVEIRGIEFNDGKAIVESKDSELRWTGEQLPVYDRRNSIADIATVTIQGTSKEQFGKTVEMVTAVILESSPDQEDEPELVFNLLNYTSNTKNHMRRPDFSKTEWLWESVSDHANISHFSTIVIISFGEKIIDQFHTVIEYGSYQPEVFENFETSCVSFLSGSENWVRADANSDLMWVSWSQNFDYPRRIQIVLNPSGKSGKIIYVSDDHTFHKRNTFEYYFKRLSHFMQLMRERVGKNVLEGQEEELPKFDRTSIVEKEGGIEHFSPEDMFILSKRSELEAVGYLISRELGTAYREYTSVYRGLVKDDNSLRSQDLLPILHGFVPEIKPEQLEVFGQAIEILAGGQKLVASLDQKA